MSNANGNATPRAVRQPRRRGGGYRRSLEHRAAAAADMVIENGWSARRAAGLFCVHPSYVGLARQLSDTDRLLLAHDELKLAGLWRNTAPAWRSVGRSVLPLNAAPCTSPSPS